MSNATEPVTATLDDARAIAAAARRATDAALARASELTKGGDRIDDHQVVVDKAAYAATAARAAIELLAAAESAKAQRKAGPDVEELERVAIAGVADLARAARDRLDPIADDLGIADVMGAAYAEVRDALRRAGH